MKKLLVSVLITVCVAMIAVYVFIPANIKLSNIVFIKNNPTVVTRILANDTTWMKSISTGSTSSSNSNSGKIRFSYKDYLYTFTGALMNTAQVKINNDQKSINSLINVIPVTQDSVAVEWVAEIDAGLNPISRIKSYNEAKEIKRDIGDILGHLKSFFEKEGNAYGMKITEHRVVDTILISTKHTYDTIPSVKEIYGLIGNLRKFILREGAKETNPPMLNINNEDGRYRTMVAIPVDKVLPENGEYVFKRMVPGKILVAEVKGGEYTTGQALKQMSLYISDNHLSSPAIPFESLITDRSLEPDTTKWITKIYYPIY